jgi:hypothetical protein
VRGLDARGLLPRHPHDEGELVGVDVDRAIELARQSSERVLGAVASAGNLLPPAPEGFADMLNTFAVRNLARAWAIEPAGS